MVTHVNNNGGWRVCGWHRQGVRNVDSNGDATLSFETKGHITLLEPSRMNVLDTDAFRDLLVPTPVDDAIQPQGQQPDAQQDGAQHDAQQNQEQHAQNRDNEVQQINQDQRQQQQLNAERAVARANQVAKAPIEKRNTRGTGQLKVAPATTTT